MKNSCTQGAMACVGAVIGAGFASGREVVTFFSRYGVHSWWLILLASSVMMLLCALCMREGGHSGKLCWCGMYDKRHAAVRWGAQLCVTLLMAITGGAMVSASGHMIMLLWPSEWAYPIGALGTLILAWVLGYGSTRPLSIISGLFTMLFLGAIVVILSKEQGQTQIVLNQPFGFQALSWAGVRAVAYAAMNLAIAIGVISKCARRSKRSACRLSAVFGLTLVAVLFVSNYLYLKHPELVNDAFPIVKLLSGFGRSGFVVSVILLYLAIFTTLIAIVCTLRNAVETHVKSNPLVVAITLGLPLLVSMVGFAQIVDSLYAPAGLCCLALVFAPLVVKCKRS